MSNSDHLSPTPAALLREVTGAARIVERQTVQTLWSGYGQLVRYRLEGSRQTSVIVKHVRWPTTERHPRGWATDIAHQRKVRSYEVEASWYERYAGRCGPTCRVPACLAVRSLGAETFLVLEDLDTAGFPARRQRVSEDELDACLSWLASFHATFMGQAPDGLWAIGTYWHLDTRPDELAALPDGPLKRAAAAIDRKLSNSQFQTLVHGDAKLENFCFSDDGRRAAAVDFQYVGGGCGMKDVAYFVSSCLDESQSEQMESRVLDLYFHRLERALAATKSQLDFASLERDWRALYPVAWTDFYRFLQGWSPGHWKLHRYSERLAHEVLASL